jgi:hypothetical protein
MNLHNILDNDENKLIFLKAIMLGINYGKSDRYEYYIENIEREINKILNNKILERKIDERKIDERKIDERKISERVNKIEEKITEIDSNNTILEKNEKNILLLESQKKYILSLIQKLSLSHYGYNYSRINLLKGNLVYLNNEIEKKRILIKKYNDEKKKNIIKDSSKNLYNKNIYYNNENYYAKKQVIPEKKENLINELERTLGGLSSLLIN